MRNAAIAVAILVAVTLSIQQLPLAEKLWRSTEVRDALAIDLVAAGVGTPQRIWSLSPLASERGLWSILPALSVFLGVLAMRAGRHRRLLLTVVSLTALSLLLGFLQLGAPQDSILNPFPQWQPALNGFFSNLNHQASALAVSVVIIASLALYDWRRDDQSTVPRWRRVGLITLGVLLLASLPLMDSRAALLIALLGLVAVPFLLRRSRRDPLISKVKSRVAGASLFVIALGVVLAAIGWLRLDIAEEARVSVAQATSVMGLSHAPLGAGLGSFTAWFDQAAPSKLIQWEYFNHAHNEYAQWWLESGVLAVLAVIGVIAVFVACYPRRSSETSSSGDHGVGVAAWLGCALILLQSLVDYPLRTPGMMTIASLLAGIVVSQHVSRTVGTGREKRALPPPVVLPT